METIKNIWFEKGRIYMLSSEDKVYSRPLEAFPLLKDATERQRMDYTIELHGEALRWDELDEDIHISSFYTKDEPKYDNEVAMLFKRFPQLNVSEVARNLGINKSLLSKYIYGIKTPSAERVCQIKNALRALGRELAAV
ncbi:MAG: DUF2442 domain-containing protein [Clostridiales bacterium]|nr:DUF2442 domain-containing protein [Clostridiales bacterium]MDY3104512.1 DUF2442 domain-containing protein [Prevotella sp.]